MQLQRVVEKSIVLSTGIKGSQEEILFQSIPERLKPSMFGRLAPLYKPGIGELIVPRSHKLYDGKVTMKDGKPIYLFDNLVPLSEYLPAWLRDLAVFPGKEGFRIGSDVVDADARTILPAKFVPEEAMGRNDVMLSFDSRWVKDGWRCKGMQVLVPEGAARIYQNNWKCWPIEFPAQARVAGLVFRHDAEKGFFVASENHASLYSIAWFKY